MPETDKSKRFEAICFKRSLFGRSFDYYSSAELYLFGHHSSSGASNSGVRQNFAERKWAHSQAPLPSASPHYEVRKMGGEADAEA
jgi:hypothetical protein